MLKIFNFISNKNINFDLKITLQYKIRSINSSVTYRNLLKN